LTGTAYHSSSDAAGSFSFDDVPSGTYVLHIEGGSAGERGYDATDLLLKVSPKAPRQSLLLTRRDGGTCGGTELDLVEPPGR
ncbi:MAG: carboxypeptidase regulatory-like domain-containing protein, partial [Acidobacteria bacterium]|nr:carboxypeptidase regulatory-like domain-containing protein [Acidobacteriota bacterium]